MKNDKTRASVTIEAAIALTITMAAVLTMNGFLKVTYVHSVVQHALIQTANEMATYDYILSLLGISEIDAAIEQRTNGNAGHATDAIENINGKIAQFNSVLSAMDGSSGSTGSSDDNTGKTSDNGFALAGNDNMGVDADSKTVSIGEVIKSFLDGAIGNIYSETKSTALNLLTSRLIQTYIPKDSDNRDILERNMVFNDTGGTETKGVKALDFSASKYFEYPEFDTMEISCSYKVKIVSPIPIIDYVPMVNTVKVRAWQDKWSTVSTMLQSSTSVWVLNGGSATGVYNKVVKHAFPDWDKETTHTFVSYNEASKTAVKATTINFINGTYAESGKVRTAMQQDLNKLRNPNGWSNDVNVRDVNKVEYYVFVPAESAVMATDIGIRYTEKNNELETAKSEGKSDEEIKRLQNELSELKRKVNEKKSEVKKKAGWARQEAKGLERDFNDEDNGFKISIKVMVVDYPDD